MFNIEIETCVERYLSLTSWREEKIGYHFRKADEKKDRIEEEMSSHEQVDVRHIRQWRTL